MGQRDSDPTLAVHRRFQGRRASGLRGGERHSPTGEKVELLYGLAFGGHAHVFLTKATAQGKGSSSNTRLFRSCLLFSSGRLMISKRPARAGTQIALSPGCVTSTRARSRLLHYDVGGAPPFSREEAWCPRPRGSPADGHEVPLSREEAELLYRHVSPGVTPTRVCSRLLRHERRLPGSHVGSQLPLCERWECP